MTDFEKEVLEYVRFRRVEMEKTDRTLIFLHVFLGIAF